MISRPCSRLAPAGRLVGSITGGPSATIVTVGIETATGLRELAGSKL